MILVTMAVNSPSATPRSGRCDGASSDFSSSCASSCILCSRQKSSHVDQQCYALGARALPFKCRTSGSTMFPMGATALPFKSCTSGSTVFPSGATALPSISGSTMLPLGATALPFKLGSTMFPSRVAAHPPLTHLSADADSCASNPSWIAWHKCSG